MAIEIACSCGKKLKLRDELAGKKVKCPSCAAVLLVRSVAEPANGEDAPPPKRPAPASADRTKGLNKAAVRDEEEEDEEEEERLARKEKASPKKPAEYDDEDDDRPSKNKSKVPERSLAKDRDDEEDERDDEDDRPRKKKKAKKKPPYLWLAVGGGGAVVAGVVVLIIVLNSGDGKTKGSPTPSPSPFAKGKDDPVRDEPARDESARDEPVRDAPVRDAPVRDEPARDGKPVDGGGDPKGGLDMDKTKSNLSPAMGKWYERPGLIVAYILPEHAGWWEKVAMGQKVRIRGRPFGVTGRWVRVTQSVPYEGPEKGVNLVGLLAEFDKDGAAARERYIKNHAVLEGTVVGWQPNPNAIVLIGPGP